MNTSPNLVSIYSWRQIVIHFDSKKLELLQSSDAYLYILQDVISTNPKLCSLSFGASIDLKKLNNKASLTILVDKWPFYFAIYANRGIIPSNWDYNILYKQSLSQNFIEVYARDNYSPEIKWVQPETVASQNSDIYTLGYNNKSSDPFYIGLGRAFQWGAGEKTRNDPDWQESIIGCHCFFLLDSNSTTYFRPSEGIALLISSQRWNNGAVLQENISGYKPCYFKLEEKETIILYYDKNDWIKRSGNPELQLFDYKILTKKIFEDYLIKDMSIKPLDKRSKLLHYGDQIKLCVPKKSGYIISASYELGGIDIRGIKQYFPRFSESDTPIKLLLSGGSEIIKDGDTVKIETTETSVGEFKVLGAWSTVSLYYYKDGYDNQKWIIRKKNKNDSAIHYGDEVYFLNHYYKDQWLCIEDSGTWLTTRKDAKVYWLIDQP